MRALVTGGNGFMGAELVRQLRERGHQVDVASRQTGVDLADAAAVSAAVAGHDVVFHAAAKAGVWGSAEEYERTNLAGTQAVVEACRQHGVGRLVYTSSPSVVFDGSDHVDAGADLPYPATFLAHYPRTKAEAEQRVLAADSPGLRTIALRPHLIYGPGDPHLLPRLLARARAGRLRIVGNGQNRVSLTYVANAAAAHVQAAEALAAPDPIASGRAFFVNDAEPVVLWAWLNRLFGRLGIPEVTRRVPTGLAYTVGALCEWTWGGLALAGEPPMTRFVAQQLATTHTYSLKPAQDAFGYAPPVGGDDAFERTVASLRTA